jgi:hypothetical protein
MFHIVWVFVAAPERVGDFAAAYGPKGGSRFLTIDRWDSRSAYERFRRERGSDYARLDAACEALTVQEDFLGAFGE